MHVDFFRRLSFGRDPVLGSSSRSTWFMIFPQDLAKPFSVLLVSSGPVLFFAAAVLFVIGGHVGQAKAQKVP